jgi:DNA-binding Lrp family transcriptional regulator
VRHVVKTGRQLASLAGAARQEIVDVLAEMGTVSIAEIAAALGRPADALYFHVRALMRAGLVQHAGYRLRGARKEALIRTVAAELVLLYDPDSTTNRRAITAAVSSMLRLGDRDFRRAFKRGNVTVSGARRELWALRKVGRVSPQNLAKVNQLIKKLARSVSKADSVGRLYGITVILTPLDHRPRMRVGRL